jgi:hypothetical protein
MDLAPFQGSVLFFQLFTLSRICMTEETQFVGMRILSIRIGTLEVLHMCT